MSVPRRPAPLRARRTTDGDRAKPIYAVWEVTMHCDQPCQHCGSRAGPTRPSELNTEEALDVVASLARLGCREVVLIGGEAYLRPDIEVLIRALVDAGLRVIMQTGGRGLHQRRLDKLVAAGLSQIGVSVDGPAEIHDELRGNRGSHAAALAAIDRAIESGVKVSANSQINRLNYRRLKEMAAELQAHGVIAWQVTLTVPMGRAADRPAWLLPPHRVVEVIDTLAEIQLEAAARAKPGQVVFDVAAGNTVGYYGPHEQVIRSRPGGRDAMWTGCSAGYNTIGIESDGTIKGCPSLPTGPYGAGSVRDLDLDTIWWNAPEVRFNRERNPKEELWGRCATCYYSDVCKGGCSWMAHTTFGRRGNNPFCYHRAETLRKEGLRERLVPRKRAPDEPYDFGGFDVEEVPFNTPEDDDPVMKPNLQGKGDGRKRLPLADNSVTGAAKAVGSLRPDPTRLQS